MRWTQVPAPSQRLNPQFGAKAPQVTTVPKGHQLTGNNIEVEGFDLAGDHKSPAYNMKCGFSDGEFVKKFFFFLIMYSFLSNGLGRCPEWYFRQTCQCQ